MPFRNHDSEKHDWNFSILNEFLSGFFYTLGPRLDLRSLHLIHVRIAKKKYVFIKLKSQLRHFRFSVCPPYVIRTFLLYRSYLTNKRSYYDLFLAGFPTCMASARWRDYHCAQFQLGIAEFHSAKAGCQLISICCIEINGQLQKRTYRKPFNEIILNL